MEVEILLRIMFQCSNLLQAASKPTMPLAGAGYGEMAD